MVADGRAQAKREQVGSSVLHTQPRILDRLKMVLGRSTNDLDTSLRLLLQ